MPCSAAWSPAASAAFTTSSIPSSRATTISGSSHLLFLFFGLSILFANFKLTPDAAPILYRITLNFSFDYLPYLGYAVWGYWLSGKSFRKAWLIIAPAVFLAVTALTTWGNIWYSHYKQIADGWLFSYFSLPSLIQATMIFCFFQALKGREFRHPKAWAALADATLGIYLLHPMLINIFQRLGLNMSLDRPVSGLLIFTAALALICTLLALAAKKLPLARKLL